MKAQYPRKVIVAFCGQCYDRKNGKRFYKFVALNEKLEPTERELLFSKAVPVARGIGVIAEIEETAPGIFNLNGKYIDYIQEKDTTKGIVEKWRAQADAESNWKEMQRKIEGEDEWEKRLGYIKRVYQGMDRRGKAALLGKLIIYLDTP